MNSLVQLSDKPLKDGMCMIAGWHQWADAGSISSGLPQYLINQTNAKRIGQIKPYGFYLFQIPGTHHFLRPEIKFDEGYRQKISKHQNEIYYARTENSNFLVFLGDEPHMNIELYADAFFDVVEELGVKRVAAIGGVYGSMPYDKEREVSCTYSLPSMKSELQKYAVRFSSYGGGATIGSYMVDEAEHRGIEFFVFNAFVPAYEFSQSSDYPVSDYSTPFAQPANSQAISIDNDFKAWYDLMRRFNYMFDLGFGLSDLNQKSDELLESMDDKMDELNRQMPQLNVQEYLAELASDFKETSFMPLDDIWATELGDLFDDNDD